jgi:RNA polymerase sigma factor (sigma-70 family)
MSEGDGRLIRKVLKGDGKAFHELIGPYQSLVHGVLMSAVRHRDEVEDLEQEVYCKAYEELPNLRSAEQFGAWIWRIATNAAHSWGRRRVRWQRCELAEIERYRQEGPGDVPGEGLELNQSNSRLHYEVERLAEPYRRVVHLYYMEGCSYKEISRCMGIALPTVKWRLLEGRKVLRRRLKRAA